MAADCNLIEKLRETIESVTTSGHKQIDEPKLGEIKKICRISDEYVTEAYKLLTHQLSQRHAEIRLAAFLVVKELFHRSHCFRGLVEADFQDFTKLVLDVDPKMPLPLPAPAAKQLVCTAVKAIKEWNEVYGGAYRKLRIGYNYLRQCKLVDFEDMEARSAAIRERQHARQAKLDQIKRARIQTLMEEITGEESEIEACATQIDSGIGLLVPDEFAQESVAESERGAGDDDLRAHGWFSNPSFKLVIDVHPVHITITEDNREVVGCLQDQYKLLSGRFLPMVLRWNVSAASLGAGEQTQKRILDWKLRLEMLKKKYLDLNLPPPEDRLADGDGQSECDSDLETVPDADQNDSDLTLAQSYRQHILDDDDDKPGTSGYRLQDRKSKPLPGKKAALPLDIDFHQASQSSLPKPVFTRNVIESYWVQDAENNVDATAALLTNPVGLSESFQPVKWSCRAPLPSGKLCPRKDRRKCPLHGLIVARDESGQPKDPSSVQSASKSNVPEWQDPTLLAEIKAATGVDLTMPVKGKRLKKAQNPNLTDVKALVNTTRSRLEKKVFNRSAVKRSASVMDRMDAKRMQGKFGDQWSYL